MSLVAGLLSGARRCDLHTSMRAAAYGALLVFRSAACAHADAGDDSLAAEMARLRHESQVLEQLLELAASSSFYLWLDPEAPRLTLRLRGAVLREYHLGRVEMGIARVLYAAQETPSTTLWHGGELDPPRPNERIEFTAPEPDSTREEGSVAPPLPPVVEDGILVPSRYRVVFPEGLEIQFLALDKKGNILEAGFSRAIARLHDLSDALRARERARIRISLAEVDHHGLYRALPPNVSLLIHSEACFDGSASRRGREELHAGR